MSQETEKPYQITMRNTGATGTITGAALYQIIAEEIARACHYALQRWSEVYAIENGGKEITLDQFMRSVTPSGEKARTP